MKLRRPPLLLLLSVLPLASARADLSGFGTNGTGFTLNQGQTTNGLSVSNNVATLTNGGNNQGNSLFSNTKQSFGAFRVSFTYQDVSPSSNGTADGFTFTLQNDTRGAAAVGGTGNSLGYAGAGGATTRAAVSPSVAVAFNIYSSSTTGLGTNGALTLGNTSLAVLGSGNPINITLAYNGTTLTETLTDTVNTANTSTFSYAVNLTSTLGSSGTAYVGFTGATGAATATQRISNFSYTVVPEPATWAAGGLTLLAGAALCWRRGKSAHG